MPKKGVSLLIPSEFVKRPGCYIFIKTYKKKKSTMEVQRTMDFKLRAGSKLKKRIDLKGDAI